MRYTYSISNLLNQPTTDVNHALRRIRLSRHEHDDRLAATTPEGSLSMVRLTDHEALISTFWELKHGDGQAPGNDWVRYDHIARIEVPSICRELETQLNDLTYRPLEARLVRIAKASGRGSRELQLRGIADRIVARRMALLFEFCWEHQFSPCSYGFRPRVGREHLLARLEHAICNENRNYVVNVDICNAFDAVPIYGAMELIAAQTTDARFLANVQTILQGGTDRRVKIDQGCSLSPIVLNILLNNVLDQVFGLNTAAHGKYFRFADNIYFACHELDQANQTLRLVRERLSTVGMSLKSSSHPIVDIRCLPTDILGYSVGRTAGVLSLTISPAAWRNLRQSLAKARDKETPAKRARECARGWIRAQGCAYASEDKDAALARVLNLIHETGHLESYTHSQELQEQWTQGNNRWCSIRAGIGRPAGSNSDPRTERRGSEYSRVWIPPGVPDTAPF